MSDDPITTEAEADETEPEFFPLGSLEGEEVTPQKLIRRGEPVEVTVSIGKAEVPLRGEGLLDPRKRSRVLVTYVYAGQEEVALHEDERDDSRITGWKIRQKLRSVYVEHASDSAKLIRSEFETLFVRDAAAASRLLDDLRALAGDALKSA